MCAARRIGACFRSCGTSFYLKLLGRKKFMAVFMTYSYHALVIFFTGIFIWILFTQENFTKQISCAILLIPLVLRMFLIR